MRMEKDIDGFNQAVSAMLNVNKHYLDSHARTWKRVERLFTAGLHPAYVQKKEKQNNRALHKERSDLIN